jgi:hypothetical protein
MPRVTKLEVLAHRQDGNREPECGHVTFADGKSYGFENSAHLGVRFHRPHHRNDTIVAFKSTRREGALLASFDDEKVQTRSPYYAQ